MQVAPSKKYDVCILGAGLAGLTLARQLRRRQPDLDIVVVEHRQFPVPEAAHKVGESTVEIAAYYLATTLGLQEHLDTAQLPKFGLRMFLRGRDVIVDDLGKYDEIGASKVLPIPTYQLDRGRFENYLAQSCCAEGTSIMDGTTVRSIEVDKRAHRIAVRGDQRERILRCRYVVDASGRRALLRGQRDLKKAVRHSNHAVWFRVEGEIELDSWSSDSSWRKRCEGTPRRLSTNHFSGPGYWLWLIPLSSGMTSVGLVFDPRCLDLQKVNQHDRLLHWLSGEHPLVAERLASAEPLDFHVLQDYAVGCKQIFDSQGWMISGDAGVFTDPFYSPGADFIAFANGYITELIAGGGDAGQYKLFQDHFLTFFVNTMSLYRGQYPGFGDRNMLVVKTVWDYTYYWATLSKLFFTGRYVDTMFMSEIQPALYRAAGLNSAMQGAFRKMGAAGLRVGGEGRFYDHHELDLFHRLKEELLAGDSENACEQLLLAVDTLDGVSSRLKSVIEDCGRGQAAPLIDVLNQAPEFS